MALAITYPPQGPQATGTTSTTSPEPIAMDNDMDHESETQAKETEMDLDGPAMASPLQASAMADVMALTSRPHPVSGLSRLFQGQSSNAGAIPGSVEGGIPYAQTLVGEDSSASSVSTPKASSSASTGSTALSPGKHTIPVSESTSPKRPSTFVQDYFRPSTAANPSILPPFLLNQIPPPVHAQGDPSPREWMQHLYSPQAGTSTPITTLLQKLDRKGLASAIVRQQLERVGDYELESYTFLQEIIPNLFLGRYLTPYPLS